jgi:hypothetical protein
MHEEPPRHGSLCRSLQLPRAQVAVLTGFPCVMKHDPPTETDGICGALAIARAACLSGKSAVVLTDDCNAAVVRAAVAAANGRLAPPLLPAGATATCAAAAAAGAAPPPCAMIRVESFPAGGACDERHRARMHAAARGADLLVAVERVRALLLLLRHLCTCTVGATAANYSSARCRQVSRALDGDCYTMRGLSMAHLAAPLDDLFIAAPGRGAATIGIGDGGNELGYARVSGVDDGGCGLLVHPLVFQGCVCVCLCVLMCIGLVGGVVR